MAVKKICILGLGHAGVPLGAVIALKCPEIRVTVVQSNPDDIFQLNVKRIPPAMYVPGLEELIRKCQNKNLFFTSTEDTVIKEADIIFILSESTLKTYGDGKNQYVELSPIEETAHLIAEHAENDKIIVENSAIPLRTSECIKSILRHNSRPGLQFQVLSNPEFYEEGSCIKNLLFPDCVLIGCENTSQSYAAAKILAGIYERWVPARNIVTRKNWTAELAKIATTAMIAQRLAAVFAMCVICEESGGSVSHLIRVLMKDSTIGGAGLEPNLNVGRFPAIIRNFVYMCDFMDLTEVADYWRQVLEMFTLYKDRFLNKLVWTMNQTAWNKRVAVLGFAYHKGTQVTNGSAAIELCKTLVEETAVVNVFDASVTQQQVIECLMAADCSVSEEGLKKMVTVYEDPYKATSGVQVLVGCGVWPDFADLDYTRIFSEMVKPAFVFDSGLIFDHTELLKIGFKVYSSGKFVKNLT